MSETVKNPTSTESVRVTINANYNKQQLTPVVDQFLSTSTNADLTQYFTDYPVCIAAFESAESTKINAVSEADVAADLLELDNTCGLENINLLIKRGILPASVRPLFLMTANSNALPPMTTRADLVNVSNHITTGTAELISKGLTPSEDFPAATNALIRQDYIAKANAANLATEAYNAALLTLAEMRNICRELCITVRQELDFHYIKLSESAKRDMLRLWGIVYAPKKDTTEIDILSKFADGSGVAAGALFRVGLTETKATKKVPTPAVKGASKISDAHGSAIIETTQSGDVFIIGTLANYKDIAVPITIIRGEDISRTVFFEKLPPEA